MNDKVRVDKKTGATYIKTKDILNSPKVQRDIKEMIELRKKGKI